MTDTPPTSLPEDDADATSKDYLVEQTDDSPDAADGDQDAVDQDPVSEDDAVDLVAAALDEGDEG